MDCAKNNGFTVTEFMTMLLITVFIFGIGRPAYIEFIDNNRVIAATNEVAAAIHLARSEAIKRRANVTLCPSANWNAEIPACDGTGSFADGWIIFTDCTQTPPPVNTCGAPNSIVDMFDTVLTTHGPLDNNIADNFTTNPGTPTYISFSATGFPRTIISMGITPKNDFQICDHRGNHDVGDGVAAGRWLRISAIGRPQIYSTVTEIQSTARNPLGGC